MPLVEDLIKQGWLKTPEITAAFRAIKRRDFLPEESKELAEFDTALPIGFGQTISQPLVVAFMIEQLNPKKGKKVLDIGAGSGWTTALLAHIVGETGRVVAIEVIPELADFGARNVAVYNFITKGIVKYVCGNGAEGYAKEAPFDKILASASLPAQAGLQEKSFPPAWEEQLRPGGMIVAPIQNSIWVFKKKQEGGFEEKEYPGFVFVPFIQK